MNVLLISIFICSNIDYSHNLNCVLIITTLKLFSSVLLFSTDPQQQPFVVVDQLTTPWSSVRCPVFGGIGASSISAADGFTSTGIRCWTDRRNSCTLSLSLPPSTLTIAARTTPSSSSFRDDQKQSLGKKLEKLTTFVEPEGLGQPCVSGQDSDQHHQHESNSNTQETIKSTDEEQKPNQGIS